MVDSKPIKPGDAAEAEVANRIADTLDADILFYNGYIEPPLDRKVIGLGRERKRRKNVMLVLVTLGGDADSAYRIAKFLQSKYEKFYLYVTGYCKSAGTLIALGAHELIFADEGELGPLDVQMEKLDSLWETQSGLTATASLVALQERAYLAFEQYFLQTEDRSQGQITVRTAAEIATNLTIGLFAPLYSQIDPLHVGEAARALTVANHYGMILAQATENIEPGALHHLVTHYPSHGIVIDRDEALKIFQTVRPPTDDETKLADLLGDDGVIPIINRRSPVVKFLSKEKELTSPAEESDSQALADRIVNTNSLEDRHGRTETDSQPTVDRPAPQPRA